MVARRWWLAFAVFGLTVWVFWPAVRGGFVMIDDPVYITTNPLVRAGLTAHGVREAFVTPVADLWLPLSLLSHMLDVSLWGLEPAGHHLTNVLLHGLNAALVFLVLEALTAAAWPSLAVALLFALHPLRVESVAWITERKDLLSACFALLTVDAYRRWLRSPTAGRYLALCGLFALALMAKPMVVTVPILLLLLDCWPFARTDVGWPRRLLEKVPLAGLAGAAAWATMCLAEDARVSFEALPLAVRVGNAAVSNVRYLAAMAWPSGLAVYYPFPPPWALPTVVAATMLAVCLALGALALRGRAPYLAVGYAWYLVALVPVAGIVQAGMQARADRFTYLPSIGILVALVWGASALVSRHRWLCAPVAAAMVAAMVGSAAASRVYLGFWHDDHALFERALAVTGRNWFVHSNYGDTLLFEGKLDEAAAHYEQALAIEPHTPTARNRLGTIRLRRGDPDAALEQFIEALREEPAFEEAARNAASALEAKGMEPRVAEETVGALDAGLRRSAADLARFQGRGYQQSLVGVLWKEHGPAVARCRTDLGPAPPFELFLTVGANGRVTEAAASPPSPLAACVAASVTEARLPAPPFAPFHAWLTMRLGA